MRIVAKWQTDPVSPIFVSSRTNSRQEWLSLQKTRRRTPLYRIWWCADQSERWLFKQQSTSDSLEESDQRDWSQKPPADHQGWRHPAVSGSPHQWRTLWWHFCRIGVIEIWGRRNAAWDTGEDVRHIYKNTSLPGEEAFEEGFYIKLRVWHDPCIQVNVVQPVIPADHKLWLCIAHKRTPVMIYQVFDLIVMLLRSSSHLRLTSRAALMTEEMLLVSICSRATWAVGREARRAERAPSALRMFLQARQSWRPSMSSERRRSHSPRPMPLQGNPYVVLLLLLLLLKLLCVHSIQLIAKSH